MAIKAFGRSAPCRPGGKEAERAAASIETGQASASSLTSSEALAVLPGST